MKQSHFRSRPILYGNLHLTRGLYALALLYATQVNAEWHEQFKGSGMFVHHVLLTGQGGDNAAARKLLLDAYDSCTKSRPNVQPLPDGRFPNVVTELEIEIYYGANRTLDIQKSRHHSLNRDSCAIETTTNHKWSLRSAAGKCDVDLLAKRASGDCDMQSHAKAKPWKLSATSKLASTDLSKLPPELQAKVKAGIEQTLTARSNTLSPNPYGLIAAAESKSILNHSCRVYRNSVLKQELCIAQPDLNASTSLQPLPIPAAPLNAGVEGVLLQTVGTAMSLTAKQIDWGLAASTELFALPSGVELPTSAGK